MKIEDVVEKFNTTPFLFLVLELRGVTIICRIGEAY